MSNLLIRILCAAGFALASAAATAANIAYISSSSGYMLNNSGGTAVTANWAGQAPIQGFSGYGQIQMNGQCLTGKTGNQPLTWEGCRGGDKSQIWSLSNRKLNNEGGWCADVEGNRGGAGVRVLAWKCSGAGNQQWGSHYVESAQATASRISNAAVRSTFLSTVQGARPGAIISLSTGKLIGQDGGGLVAAGGGNIVAAGGGNIVAAGGGN
jgi:hypothetical protein